MRSLSTTTRSRRRYRRILAACVAGATLVAAPWLYLRISAMGDVYGPGETPQHADVAIVLGAKVGDDGVPSVFLAERVDLGIALYLDGVVDRLIMTGATGPDGYDEAATMRDRALAAGVPAEDIEMDREGWDTFASCENAATEFSVHTAIVVTQEFHVARATWLCQQAGIDAQGAYPRIGARAGTVTGNVREVGAAWKAVLNVLMGR